MTPRMMIEFHDFCEQHEIDVYDLTIVIQSKTLRSLALLDRAIKRSFDLTVYEYRNTDPVHSVRIMNVPILLDFQKFEGGKT